MRLAPAQRLAARALVRFPLRTALMMAGLAVGIGALTMLNVLGEATRLESVKRFKSMLGSIDTIMVRPGAARTRGMVSLTNVPPTLKFQDAAAITAEVPGVSQVALLQNAFEVDARYRDRSGSTAVFGVSANWQRLRGEDAAAGRFISDDDVAARARVAVLGADVAATLFAGASPLGTTLEIGGVPFLVIGTLPARGAGPGGGSLDDLIMIPVTTAAVRLFNRDFLTMVIVQLREPDKAEASLRDIRELLRTRHHTAASALDDFTLTSPAAMLKSVTQVKSTLTTLLRGVAIAATTIGSLVIFGLTLQSVAQRRGTIGIARAVGATRADIVAQFMLEAGWTALLGGGAGILGGAAIALAVTRSQGLPAIAALAALGEGLGLTLAVALAAGLYPAWRAARVDPVEALRA
jgi:putative ABC transport system permease protein